MSLRAFENGVDFGLAEEEALVTCGIVEVGLGSALEHEGFCCPEPPVGRFA